MLIALLIQSSTSMLPYPDGTTAIYRWDLEHRTEVAILAPLAAANKVSTHDLTDMESNGMITSSMQSFKVVQSNGKLPETILMVFPGGPRAYQGQFGDSGLVTLKRFVALVRPAEYGEAKYALAGWPGPKPIWKQISGAPGEYVPVAMANTDRIGLPRDGSPLDRFVGTLVSNVHDRFSDDAIRMLSALRESDGKSLLPTISPKVLNRAISQGSPISWSSLEYVLTRDASGAIEQMLKHTRHLPQVASSTLKSISKETHPNAWADLQATSEEHLWVAIVSAIDREVALELMRFTKGMPPKKLGAKLTESFEGSLSHRHRYRYLTFLASRSGEEKMKPKYESGHPGPIKHEAKLWEHWRKTFATL